MHILGESKGETNTMLFVCQKWQEWKDGRKKTRKKQRETK